MINLSDISSSHPLIILRGEYGVVKGEDILIASPNAKNGIILIMFDQENKITAMAHFDSEDNLEENVEKVFNDIIEAGAEIKNLKCHLMSKNHGS
jgi:chemotaxis receptor (MCP) glutamine deamidase CheD